MAIVLPSYVLRGLEAQPMQIEIEVRSGIPMFAIIGMAGASVQEARDRVRLAMESAGYKFPLTKKVINLAPAEVPKQGSHWDLAMALGLLMASDQIRGDLSETLVVGELGLEGGVKPVRGLVSALLFARRQGFKRMIVPAGNSVELSWTSTVDLFPVSSLKEAIELMENGFLKAKNTVATTAFEHETRFGSSSSGAGLNVISGQAAAKRALWVAAAGGHHVLMNGPPGTGKSLLAQAFADLLPPLSNEEHLEILQIYSVAGEFQKIRLVQRPFRSVHSSLSPYGLVGGGSDLMPGEISLAHRGVLFMDEMPEFPRRTLELLRAPLEEGVIRLRRRGETVQFPSRFQLLAAMNPCPCGYFGDREHACRCSAADRVRYAGKLSGPLLDRIDIHLDVPRISYDELTAGGGVEPYDYSEKSAAVVNFKEMQSKVIKARERQRARMKAYGLQCNQEMGPALIQKEILSLESNQLLKQASKHYALSGRAIHRIVKVARSIADLEGFDRIQDAHLMEALHYRLK